MGTHHDPPIRILDTNHSQDFVHDRWEGRGRYEDANGTVYDGDWVANVMEGQGSMYDADVNETYVGEFRNNKRHGKGEVVDADGNKYSGQFREGLRHGHGHYTLYPDKGKNPDRKVRMRVFAF